MPHINVYIRKDQYHIWQNIKRIGLWPQFMSDCLDDYDMPNKHSDVVCVFCEKHVYRVKGVIKPGEAIRAGLFLDIGYGRPRDGDTISCPNCKKDLSPSLESFVNRKQKEETKECGPKVKNTLLDW